jgi:hypothetical protein
MPVLHDTPTRATALMNVTTPPTPLGTANSVAQIGRDGDEARTASCAWSGWMPIWRPQ